MLRKLMLSYWITNAVASFSKIFSMSKTCAVAVTKGDHQSMLLLNYSRERNSVFSALLEQAQYFLPEMKQTYYTQ